MSNKKLQPAAEAAAPASNDAGEEQAQQAVTPVVVDHPTAWRSLVDPCQLPAEPVYVCHRCGTPLVFDSGKEADGGTEPEGVRCTSCTLGLRAPVWHGPAAYWNDRRRHAILAADYHYAFPRTILDRDAGDFARGACVGCGSEDVEVTADHVPEFPGRCASCLQVAEREAAGWPAHNDVIDALLGR